MEDLETLLDMALEEKEESLETEIEHTLMLLEEQYQTLANVVLMREESDTLSAFLTIHSGAGVPRLVIGLLCCIACIIVGWNKIILRFV